MGVPFAHINETSESIKRQLEEILEMVRENPDDLFDDARRNLLKSCGIVSEIFIAAEKQNG